VYAFQRLARRAILAAAAVSAIGAAGSACANTVSISRWECPDGSWELNTYESTDGGPEMLVDSSKTNSPCPKATAFQPQLSSTYRLEPKFDLRPQLRYPFEERQTEQRVQQPFHISTRNAF
jgi:hypothetical protein